MNTSSAHKTVDKIIDSYPAGQQSQIRAMLAESLKAVFTQRLLPRTDGQGVAMAYELLLGSVQLGNLIKDQKTFQIPNLMQTGKTRGMRLMDDSLIDLLQKKIITPQLAIKNASNLKSFEQWIKPAGAPAAGAPRPAAAPAAKPPAAPPRAPGQTQG